MRVERTRSDRDPVAVAAELRGAQPAPEEVAGAVAAIVAEVESGGDGALRELTRRLDGADPPPPKPRVPEAEIETAAAAVPAELRRALEAAAANIRAVAEAERAALADVEVELEQGQRVRIADTPVAAAGVYAPGGRAAYPSSVLMCCLPARVAGVGRIAVASPPGPDGTVNPTVLVACEMAGVDEVYATGGAQAIAALALGTESVAAVDLIVGPGNRYVVEAKQLLSGRVGTDGIAGPSELVVVADAAADPRRVALDLCAQAEHGTDGLLVAISADSGLLDGVEAAATELATERPSVTDATLSVVEVTDLDAALELADALAPEHLELELAAADGEMAAARVAGCVFIGAGGGTAFGDYAAGSNHVLPTGGAARFGGPLGVRAFLRRTSVVSIDSDAASRLAPTVETIARAEGLPVHGESAQARGRDNGSDD
jgi:histidinol dehydrogenase